MTWNERIRRLVGLVPFPALLLAAACGGDDNKSPTGPGGEQQTSSNYQLVALGFVGLPADLALEDCAMTRFYSGGLQVTDDGSWEIKLKVHDDNLGDWSYKDEGQYEQDGETVRFDSQVTDMSYEGTVAGGELRVMYDWCENGVTDVQLVFGL